MTRGNACGSKNVTVSQMSQMDLDIESMIQGKKGILMRIIINNTTLDIYGFICDICDTVTTLQREGIFYVTGEKVLSVTACDKNKTHREFFICRFPPPRCARLNCASRLHGRKGIFIHCAGPFLSVVLARRAIAPRARGGVHQNRTPINKKDKRHEP